MTVNVPSPLLRRTTGAPRRSRARCRDRRPSRCRRPRRRCSGASITAFGSLVSPVTSTNALGLSWRNSRTPPGAGKDEIGLEVVVEVDLQDAFRRRRRGRRIRREGERGAGRKMHFCAVGGSGGHARRCRAGWLRSRPRTAADAHGLGGENVSEASAGAGLKAGTVIFSNAVKGAFLRPTGLDRRKVCSVFGYAQQHVAQERRARGCGAKIAAVDGGLKRRQLFAHSGGHAEDRAAIFATAARNVAASPRVRQRDTARAAPPDCPDASPESTA